MFEIDLTCSEHPSLRGFVQGIINKLWWKFIPTDYVILSIPYNLQVLKQPNSLIWGNDLIWLDEFNSSYKPWLNKNVGKQGWDWDWRLIVIETTDDMFTYKKFFEEQVIIKLRKKHKRMIPFILLKWS